MWHESHTYLICSGSSCKSSSSTYVARGRAGTSNINGMHMYLYITAVYVLYVTAIQMG